jgi:hypothetical protein
MASYLLTFPTAHDGGDVVRIMDAMDTLAEADRKGRLSIRYSDITSAFYRTIVEFFDDDILVNDLRKGGWIIELAPAGVYQRPPIEEMEKMFDPHAIRIVSDGGQVEPLRLATERLRPPETGKSRRR